MAQILKRAARADDQARLIRVARYHGAEFLQKDARGVEALAVGGDQGVEIIQRQDAPPFRPGRHVEELVKVGREA